MSGENTLFKEATIKRLVSNVKITSTATACVLRNETEERFEGWEKLKCPIISDGEILYNGNINQSCSTQDGKYYLYASLSKEGENCVKSYEGLK